MTDEEIVEAMAIAYAKAWRDDIKEHLGQIVMAWGEMGDNQKNAMRRCAWEVFSNIAKPLIAREARERALQQAMIAVQGVINSLDSGRSGFSIRIISALHEAKAAILALSNNPEVGG